MPGWVRPPLRNTEVHKLPAPPIDEGHPHVREAAGGMLFRVHRVHRSSIHMPVPRGKEAPTPLTNQLLLTFASSPQGIARASCQGGTNFALSVSLATAANVAGKWFWCLAVGTVVQLLQPDAAALGSLPCLPAVR